MAGLEQIIFEIITKDNASEGLSKAGKSAREAAGNVDDLTKALEVVGRKSATARVELKGDKEATASLDKIDARLLSLDRRTTSTKLTVEGAARAIAEISAVNLELDKIGSKGGAADKATTSLAALAGQVPGGGMAAVIAGGVVLSPIIATLAAGLGGFGLAAFQASKNTQAMTQILGPLKDEFGKFSDSLQPEVLSAFNTGVQLAAHLLGDIQPVAAATGKALDGVLGQIDAEFQSGTWQQFFGFMAQTAGPDIQLLGNLFVQLADTLPPLLESIQPLAEDLLNVATALTKVVGAGAQVNLWAETYAGNQQVATQQTSGFHLSLTQMLGELVAGAGNFFTFGLSAGKAGDATAVAGNQAATAAGKVQSLSAQVTALTAAENKSLSPQLAYSNALIASANDADTMRTALQKSGNQVGTQTAQQRASFSAANTYIQDLLTTADAASKSGRGIGDQIRNIQAALPLLQSVKGGTKEYWQEVRTLVDWLNQLKQEKYIDEHVHISGDGQWAFIQGPGGNVQFHSAGGGITPGYAPGHDVVPMLTAPGEGHLVPEAVRAIGPSTVHALNAAYGGGRRSTGLIQGAGGGIVPSYSGTVGGLTPWGQANRAASINEITAKSLSNALNVFSSMFGGGAIASYAQSFLGRIPYVWGGTAVPGGADCSGFTQAIYAHFGIGAPRTSEDQYAWVKKSGPVPGGLAFYISNAGGAPPGHVAIVKDGSTVISQGGGMGPQLMGINAMPLMGTGVPPGARFAGGGTGGNFPIMPGATGSLQQIAQSLLTQFGWGGQWGSFDALETREAGWNMNAVNPTSGAYGLAQFIQGAGEYALYGGTWLTGVGQLTGMMNYISQRYGSPDAAWGHEIQSGWYDRGGYLPPGLSLALNTTGRAEPVGVAAGTTVIINVSVPATVNPREAGRQVADLILAHTKAGGRLYPQGVAPR